MSNDLTRVYRTVLRICSELAAPPDRVVVTTVGDCVLVATSTSHLDRSEVRHTYCALSTSVPNMRGGYD